MTDVAPPPAELVPPGARPIPNEPEPGDPAGNGHHPNGHRGRPAPAPPHDLAAEESVLGAMMLTASAIPPVLEVLGAGDFYKPGHGQVFDAIRSLHAAGHPADSVTVGAELRRTGILDQLGGPAVLAQIMSSTPATSNVARYAHIVHEHARARALMHAGHEVAIAARDHGPDVAHALLRTVVDTQAPTNRSDRLKRGTWLLDAPSLPPAIWGRDADVLWAAGEPLLITGPPGVGKTTLVAQLLRARLGLDPAVLGWPVEPETRGTVLYLASDRPQQIRRALARVFTTADRHTLDEQLAIWTGPPPGDIARNTALLLELAQASGANTIILDSLKDMAIGLADDEVGAGVNQAIQLAIANNIDVVALHHQRKGTDGKRPKTLEDLYGSTWISAGAGSVLLLWGQAGDPIVELHHLKQPASDIGPVQIEHDHNAGLSTIYRGFDLLAYVRHRPNGVTATDTAKAWLEKDKPTDNERKKAQRRLDHLVKTGQLHKIQSDTRQADGTMPPARYFPIDRHHDQPDHDTQTALDDPPDDPSIDDLQAAFDTPPDPSWPAHEPEF